MIERWKRQVGRLILKPPEASHWTWWSYRTVRRVRDNAPYLGKSRAQSLGKSLYEALCPALRPGQVVIQACGARLAFLPANGPDFNPIEHAFSNLKAFLRQAQARTQETLEAAIAAQEARGQFKHCGWSIAYQPL